MPVYLLPDGEDGDPIPPPEFPAWGTLPIDIYLLENWDVHHPDSSTETLDERRRRLVRQFLAIGAIGREPYSVRTRSWSREYSPATPTEIQIETILRPMRSETLRRHTASDVDDGVLIRTCYKDEEAHQSIYSQYINSFIPECLYLDDADLFASDLAGVLVHFPELATCTSSDCAQKQRKALQRMFKEEEDARLLYHDEDAELDYTIYQEACVVSFAFVEDEQAQADGNLLVVWIDDCGNVIRHCRVAADEADSCVGAWRECKFEGFWEYAEVGSAYLPGGVRGPPYQKPDN